MIGNLLKALFIPKDDYFSSNFDKIKTNFSNRLSYQSYIDIFEQTKAISADENISIDINNYEVGSLDISMPKFIDFSIFDKYKSTYYSFIRGFTFIFLVLFVLNSTYKMIRGTSLLNSISSSNVDKGGNK